MKTLLLTGWLGYIGSHNAVLFLEQWYQVIILDNCSNSSQEVLKNIETLSWKTPIFYHTDLRDKEAVKNIFTENTIDAVIHFAGAKAVGESCEKPFYYYENNIVGSLNLFEIMDEFSVHDIIFSSSATVYDGNFEPPFTEESPTGNTTNPYGTTKFLLENILRDLAFHKNFQVASLRYFNPIGAHSSGLLGENPKGIPNNLLPYIMKVASRQLESVQVFGDDYDTLDGTGMRDYIHIHDLAEWHLAAFNWLSSIDWKKRDGGWGVFEVINLGTGTATSVLEMIAYAKQSVGVDIPYTIQSRRNWDIASAYCSPEKAEKLLGWKAQKTVQEWVQDSWNYIEKQKNI